MVKCPWPVAIPERGSLMLACLHALLSVQLRASKPLPCNQAFRAWWWWSSWHRVLQDLTNFKILKIFLNWNIVDLKCCVTFRYIAQWVSYTYVCIYLFFFRFFSQIDYYRIWSWALQQQILRVREWLLNTNRFQDFYPSCVGKVRKECFHTTFGNLKNTPTTHTTLLLPTHHHEYCCQLSLLYVHRY